MDKNNKKKIKGSNLIIIILEGPKIYCPKINYYFDNTNDINFKLTKNNIEPNLKDKIAKINILKYKRPKLILIIQ